MTQALPPLVPKTVTCVQPLKFEKVMQGSDMEPKPVPGNWRLGL